MKKLTNTPTNHIKRLMYTIYLASFLTAFHFSLTIYIESSFLENVLKNFSSLNADKMIGVVYTISAFISFILFVNISKILRKFGNFLVAFTFVFVEILSLLALALLQSPVILTGIFILHSILIGVIFFSNDIFLERFSKDNETGSIRGIFLTTMSVAGLLAPLIAGFIVTDGDFGKLFITSAFILSPVLLFLTARFKNFEDPEYDDVKLLDGIKNIWKRKNIYKIMISNFILRLFYVWMVVYTPIHLHQNIGIDFQTIIGVIIPIALLPFVIFNFIIGKIADEKLGEKELLTAGFIITGITTALIPFITTNSVFVWASLLFMTRIGASFIEMMTETYFFKKIDATDAYMIGFFRNLRPLAYIIGPLIATMFLFFMELNYIFFILAVILFVGIRYSLTLEDTL